MKKLISLFRYLEPLWLGTHDKISIRRVLAIVFSINMISNISFAIRQWEVGKSYSDVAMLLGIEAALIAALLTLTTYSNMLKQTHHDRSINAPENQPFTSEGQGGSERDLH